MSVSNPCARPWPAQLKGYNPLNTVLSARKLSFQESYPLDWALRQLAIIYFLSYKICLDSIVKASSL
jgi:hypothetical protein